MKEYKLKINGGYDFVVIASQTLSSLISKIHDSPEAELCVRAEDIMPSDFAKYLVNVIMEWIKRQMIFVISKH